MPYFVIKFNLLVRENSGKFRGGSSFERIIWAQNIDEAGIVAEATTGEEIFALQYLDKVVSIKETATKPGITSYCNNHYAWPRVLQRLGLSESGNHLKRETFNGAEMIMGVVFANVLQLHDARSRIS
mgnify:CR=1 FL=1